MTTAVLSGLNYFNFLSLHILFSHMQSFVLGGWSRSDLRPLAVTQGRVQVTAPLLALNHNRFTLLLAECVTEVHKSSILIPVIQNLSVWRGLHSMKRF